jgi:YD repeat-containing protein
MRWHRRGMPTQEVQPVSSTSSITTSFGYNAAGNLTSAATSNTAPSPSPSNATSEAFTYNDRGQVLTAAGSG